MAAPAPWSASKHAETAPPQSVDLGGSRQRVLRQFRWLRVAPAQCAPSLLLRAMATGDASDMLGMRRNLVLLLESDSSSSSSSSSSGSDSSSDSSSDNDVLYTRKFSELFGPPTKRPKVERYVENTVHQYSDEEVSTAYLEPCLFCAQLSGINVNNVYLQFRRNFRMSRRVAYKLIDEFEASPLYPAADHGGSPAKSAEQHLLSFLW